MLCVLRGCVCLCQEQDWTSLTIPILTEGGGQRAKLGCGWSLSYGVLEMLFEN